MNQGQCDLSSQEQRILQEEAKQRAALRKEYIKQITNPYRHGSGEGGVLFDSGMQRFISARATLFQNFKPTATSAKWGMLLLVFPFGLYSWLMFKSRDEKEKKFRTGQVAYRDRWYKYA